MLHRKLNWPMFSFGKWHTQRKGWSKADLHLHTTYSDGLMSPEETIDIIATQTDLRVIAITDHYITTGAYVAKAYAAAHYPELEVIIGQEVETEEGDVLGLYLYEDMPSFKTALEAIEAVKAQRGLAIAPHPFTIGWGTHSLFSTFTQLPFDAVEVQHGCPASLLGNVATRYLNFANQQLPELGNSDAHIPYLAGQSFTWFKGHSADDLFQAITQGQVSPGGPLWTLRGLWRSASVIGERGWPNLADEQTIRAISK